MVLQVECEGQRYDLPIGPRMVTAKPPGVFFLPLSPPLTLAQLQAGARNPPAGEYATFVHIRRLGGRWEVFFDARRPGPADANDQSLPENLDSFDELRGIEAVTLLLGDRQGRDPAAPSIWLTIPETGYWHLAGGINDGTLQIHRRSHADRWCCRVVLPDAWVAGAAARGVLIGCVRSHGAGSQLETGPSPSAPWRVDPGRAVVRLDQWDDLPQVAEEPAAPRPGH
jgi:hypothetical protein